MTYYTRPRPPRPGLADMYQPAPAAPPAAPNYDQAAQHIAGRLGFAVPQPAQAAPPPPQTAGNNSLQGVRPQTPQNYAVNPAPNGIPNHPNAQASPQFQAMSEEIRRRLELNAQQKLVEDRGVFSGQQQAAAPVAAPSFALPALYQGGR